ncbi:hypothetical protein [Tepidimicrobium xylanilyticum]|uniref:Uncharacterized protein n=1 Tax=Tepidimicrobium xylanilyticum TaxID=1123352 RepID=A0A1H2UYU5_9FIRM|nr:hypothetical protein [Tepidimicrobium xylanilyticum]GMG96774.1 hypothetical protein EN5CB1_16000 [Tepidimicrobium xylanilyticum]SDW61235.1 hypothetical protein SAMN05660923_00968 [Tepidimicrobium xylanilyticum]
MKYLVENVELNGLWLTPICLDYYPCSSKGSVGCDLEIIRADSEPIVEPKIK